MVVIMVMGVTEMKVMRGRKEIPTPIPAPAVISSALAFRIAIAAF